MISRLNSDKGISLIELIVAMTLVMMIVTPLSIFLGSNLKSYFAGSPPPRVKQVLYDAMGEISDYLRESQGITIASSTSVTFIKSAGTTMSFLNSLQGVVERSEGAITTFVPYYNSLGPEKITLNLRFSYFTRDNHNWESVDTANISAVGIELTGSYDSYSLTLNNTVNLRRKN